MGILSKDRLTIVKNSIYYNNSKEYLLVENFGSTILLDLGSDCAIYFKQRSTIGVLLAIKAARQRNGVNSRRNSHPCPVRNGFDEKKWWLGRVQRIWSKYNGKWDLEPHVI